MRSRDFRVNLMLLPSCRNTMLLTPVLRWHHELLFLSLHSHKHISLFLPLLRFVTVLTRQYRSSQCVACQNSKPLLALSRISPRIRVRVSVSIVYRIATGGYSWIWPKLALESSAGKRCWIPARVATKFALVSNEKTWQTTKMQYITIKTMMFTTYLQTSRSTKLTNHSAPFTPDSSVE